MFGTSYSGFNSLQIACEDAPALGAVFAIYSSDDRWTDDVHWRGGALKLVDLVDYCHYMTPMCVLPPVPAVWGDGWDEEWTAPAGDQRAVGAALAARGPARRLLAGRVGAARRRRRGLRAAHGADHAGRGLGRRLPQQLVPHGGRAGRATTSRTGCWPARGRTPTRAPRCRGRGSTSTSRWRPGSTAGCAIRPGTRRTSPTATSSSAPPPAPSPTSTCTRAGGCGCRPCRRPGRSWSSSPVRARCPSSPTPAPPRGSTAPGTCRGASPGTSASTTPARSCGTSTLRTCRSSAIRACACG